MRGRRRSTATTILLGVSVATSILALPGPGVAGARSGVTSTTQTLASGLTLTRITDPSGPYRVYELAMDPSSPASLDMVTAGGSMGSYARPSTIGSGHGALAAVNGDFSIDPGRPLHPFAQNGALKQYGFQNGATFAVSQDETATYVQSQQPTATGRNLGAKTSFAIAVFNSGRPQGGSIAAYTPYGGSGVRPPRNACAVRLRMDGKLHWGRNGVGVTRDWSVDRVRCSATAMRVKAGTTVLASNLTGAGSRTLQRMNRGNVIRIGWSYGWPDVMDTMGGMPLLVDDGVAVAPASCNSYFCSRNPRTGLGVTADGTILIVVVDGRSRTSVGMTLIGFARYLVQLGAVYALNLDGGGGSAMWVKGQGVVSHPSDSTGERPVTSAVLVLPGPDPSEATPLPFSPTHRLPTQGRLVAADEVAGGFTQLVSALQARRAMRAALDDPGSTGGLMNAIAHGGFGPTGSLPASYRRMARVYRGTYR